MSIHLKFIAPLLLAAVFGAARANTADAPPRDALATEFTAALQRARQHQPDGVDSAALRAYAIYDYLVAARLRRDLNDAPGEVLDVTIDAFLGAHPAQPVVRALRHDWLLNLAQRSRWDWFLPRSSDILDPVLSCYRLQAQLETQDTAGLAAAALARWILPQKQPAPCTPVFGWLRSQGKISATVAEERARAALAADNPRLAREAAADMQPPRSVEILRWSDLLEAPRSALNVLATHPELPIAEEALATGFDKLARNDHAAAWELLPALLGRPDSGAALQAHLKRTAALSAAYDRDPRALGAFEDLPPEAVDPQVAEWRVRAALWNGDDARALAWLLKMPATLTVQPRWRYWQARTTAATLGDAVAAPLFAQLAGLRDYYGYLAADRLHLPYQLNARASPDDAQLQAALAREPGMVRAHELFDCDLADDAAAEWSMALAGAAMPLKIQAARLAAHWGWFAQSIATLAQTGEFDDVALRYPRPYDAIVDDAGKLATLPADWIYAVMRQESLYRKDAVSRADARGLMQMLPATARAVAHRWHLDPPSRDALFDPAVAVPLGAAYLRELLDRYDGRLPLSLAAYNAGPGAVERWYGQSQVDPDVWIENIPFNETRAYVQHIVEHIVAFAWVRGAPPPRAQALIALHGSADP